MGMLKVSITFLDDFPSKLKLKKLYFQFFRRQTSIFSFDNIFRYNKKSLSKERRQHLNSENTDTWQSCKLRTIIGLRQTDAVSEKEITNSSLPIL